jgi:hypothetical protein
MYDRWSRKGVGQQPARRDRPVPINVITTNCYPINAPADEPTMT